MASAGLSGFVKLMLGVRQLRVANFGLQKCYFAGIISCGSYGPLYVSAKLLGGKRSTFEGSTSKSLKDVLYNSEVVCLVDMDFVLELRTPIFEGGLAEKLRS